VHVGKDLHLNYCWLLLLGKRSVVRETLKCNILLMPKHHKVNVYMGNSIRGHYKEVIHHIHAPFALLLLPTG